MIRQIVKDYQIIVDIPDGDYRFGGDSQALKAMVVHLFDDLDQHVPRSVLDIGFGLGKLGELIKAFPATTHWDVDGIDGFEVTCYNRELFQKKFYRNIWHGLAQELHIEQLKSYDVICLLDVIEHLDKDNAKELLRNLLSSMGEHSLLFISTPLWFYPQDRQQDGDLEEHLIGVPASSMVALRPLMYCIGSALVGNFVFNKQSLQYIDQFVPTTDRSFGFEQGVAVALQCGLKLDVGTIFKIAY
jgi:SAM-dependent methyltransferase